MLERLLATIVDDDVEAARALLAVRPALVASTFDKDCLYEVGIVHWLYRGDTALHLAAAGHRARMAALLLAAGAEHNATGRRRATPMHYAADGYITSDAWNPVSQVATIECLLRAGADADAADSNGATALHRAVRTRCADAVRCLLDAGCDTTVRNKSGSTAFHLAVQNTGRGGSGSERAKAAQRAIIETLLAHGVSPRVEDARGKSVLDWATAESVRALLERGSKQRATAKQ